MAVALDEMTGQERRTFQSIASRSFASSFFASSASAGVNPDPSSAFAAPPSAFAAASSVFFDAVSGSVLYHRGAAATGRVVAGSRAADSGLKLSGVTGRCAAALTAVPMVLEGPRSACLNMMG